MRFNNKQGWSCFRVEPLLAFALGPRLSLAAFALLACATLLPAAWLPGAFADGNTQAAGKTVAPRAAAGPLSNGNGAAGKHDAPGANGARPLDATSSSLTATGKPPTNNTQDWNEVYSQAHRYRDDYPLVAITLFRQVAQNAPLAMGQKALLQLGLIYQTAVMEPRLALKVYQEFLSTSGVKSHPRYADIQDKCRFLASGIGQIDALEGKIAGNKQSPADSSSTGTLMEIGNIYRQKLDSPKYAFETYKRAFDLTSGTFDMAYYMMGHMKMDTGENAEAVQILDDFIQRFPHSSWLESVLDLDFRCRYLMVFQMPPSPTRTRDGQELIGKIDKALADFPKIDNEVRLRLKNYKRLTEQVLKQPQGN